VPPRRGYCAPSPPADGLGAGRLQTHALVLAPDHELAASTLPPPGWRASVPGPDPFTPWWSRTGAWAFGGATARWGRRSRGARSCLRFWPDGPQDSGRVVGAPAYAGGSGSPRVFGHFRCTPAVTRGRAAAQVITGACAGTRRALAVAMQCWPKVHLRLLPDPHIAFVPFFWPRSRPAGVGIHPRRWLVDLPVAPDAVDRAPPMEDTNRQRTPTVPRSAPPSGVYTGPAPVTGPPHASCSRQAVPAGAESETRCPRPLAHGDKHREFNAALLEEMTWP